MRVCINKKRVLKVLKYRYMYEGNLKNLEK